MTSAIIEIMKNWFKAHKIIPINNFYNFYGNKLYFVLTSKAQIKRATDYLYILIKINFIKNFALCSTGEIVVTFGNNNKEITDINEFHKTFKV